MRRLVLVAVFALLGCHHSHVIVSPEPSSKWTAITEYKFEVRVAEPPNPVVIKDYSHDQEFDLLVDLPDNMVKADWTCYRGSVQAWRTNGFVCTNGEKTIISAVYCPTTKVSEDSMLGILKLDDKLVLLNASCKTVIL